MSDGHRPFPLGVTRFSRAPGLAAGAAFALPAPLGIFLPGADRPNIAPPRLSAKEQAHMLVAAFAGRAAGGVFPHILRAEVAQGLDARIDLPTLVSQEQSSLCGPSALVVNLATHDPIAYVRYVVDLFERGEADIQRLHVTAGSDLRAYDPSGKIQPADWIAVASLRDSENYFFDYQSVDNEFAGITLPGDLTSWFEKIGYRNVFNETNLLSSKDEKNLRQADLLFRDDYWVCLFINADLLSAATQTDGSMFPNHWVVQTGPLSLAGGTVSLDIFTWGQGRFHVPSGRPITLAAFLKDYYGYVAAKY